MIFPDMEGASLDQLGFMTVVYGYILMQGASLIGSGSELLLLVPRLAPLVGSVVLPVLGAVPDGMMVLMSGSGPDAQNEVAVGVGALAGSTIMLLTLPWFLAVYAGRVSINKDGNLNYKPTGGGEKLRPEHRCSLLNSAVAVREEIKTGAKWMLGTLTSYVIIQGSAFTVDLPGGTSGPVTKEQGDVRKEAAVENNFALVGLIFCVIEFAYYLYIQASGANEEDGQVDKKIIDAQVNALKSKKTTLRGVMGDMREQQWTTRLRTSTDLEQALLSDGETKTEVQRMCKILNPFFMIYDADHSKTIDREEFSQILRDVNENVSKDYQRLLFDAADADRSGSISFEEFVACVIAIAMGDGEINKQEHNESRKTIRREPTKFIVDSTGDADEEDDDEEEDVIPDDLAGLSPEQQQTRIKLRSLYQMGLGTLIVLVFSDPMVDLLGEIGKQVGVPAFYVSFVLAPLASNSAELLAAYNYAQKRTVKSIGTSLVQLEGAAIMNNTFCLGIFLALVYFKGLAWEFSAETVSIVSIQVALGVLMLLRSQQKLLEAFAVLSLYPLSLGLVWVLENKLGWD